MTPGILSPPELPNRFGRLIQPVAVGEQCDQFDGAEKLHRVGPGLAQRPQLSRTDENGDIIRGAVQKLRHLPRQEAGRQIFGRPACHRRLLHVVSHNTAVLIWA